MSGKHGGFDPDEPGSAPHQDDYETGDVETVTIVPVEGQIAETARALLDAADSPGDVQMSDGNFVVPAKLAAKAKVPEAKSERSTRTAAASPPPAPKGTASQSDAADPASTPRPTKTAARKAPAKKAAAKTKA